MTFATDPRTGTRYPGVVRLFADRLLPGVQSVEATIPRYARAWQRANAEAMTRSGPVWIVLGDSISQGIGAARYDRGWVGQLAQRMSSAGAPRRIINLSVSGARVADVINHQLPAMAALGLQADLITVLIGTNDLLHHDDRMLLPSRFALMLTQLPPGTVVGTMAHPFKAAHRVNAVIQAQEARGRVWAAGGVLDLSTWRHIVAADHFHPNELGHSRIADNFESAIARRADPALAGQTLGSWLRQRGLLPRGLPEPRQPDRWLSCRG